MKWCGTCKTVKPVAEFAAGKKQVDGLQGFCRPCGKDKQKAWREANREKATRLATDCHRRKKFGIEPAEYDRMLEAQGGVCAICQGICGITRTGGRRALALDHNHATGAVRGILCSACNTALGMFGDSPDVLTRAIAYLEHHQAKQLI
jgi:hypothetical protein